MLWLLKKIITSFVAIEPGSRLGGRDDRRRGLPLGNLTSQLLVNIYLHELDQFVKHVLKVEHYLRYADDFVILSQSKPELEASLAKIQVFLKLKLNLDLHPDKVSIETLGSGVDFLGWVHFPRHRVLRMVTKRRMMKRVSPDNLASYQGMLQWGNGHQLQVDLKKRVGPGMMGGL